MGVFWAHTTKSARLAHGSHQPAIPWTLSVVVWGQSKAKHVLGVLAGLVAVALVLALPGQEEGHPPAPAHEYERRRVRCRPSRTSMVPTTGMAPIIPDTTFVFTHALVEGDEEVRTGVPQRQVHLVLVHLLLRRLHRC